MINSVTCTIKDHLIPTRASKQMHKESVKRKFRLLHLADTNELLSRRSIQVSVNSVQCLGSLQSQLDLVGILSE